MSERLDELKLRLPKVKLWLVVAVLSGLVLMGYYSLEGKQYWEAIQEAKETARQIELISNSMHKQDPQDVTDLPPTLQSRERDLDQLRAKFLYPITDELMSILSTTAVEIELDLTSIAMGSATPEISEGILYDTQPVSIALKGSSEATYSFLYLLQTRVPAAEVTDIRMTSSADADTVSRVQLLVYLSPALAPDEESAN